MALRHHEKVHGWVGHGNGTGIEQAGGIGKMDWRWTTGQTIHRVNTIKRHAQLGRSRASIRCDPGYDEYIATCYI